MKLTRPLQLLIVMATAALFAPAASAASRCADDPERCVERGASVSRPSTRVVAAVPATLQSSPALTTRKLAPARKPVAKPARVAPRATPPTPGMGMLLKLSSGSGRDVSWLPAGNVDNSGASWIL